MHRLATALCVLTLCSACDELKKRLAPEASGDAATAQQGSATGATAALAPSAAPSEPSADAKKEWEVEVTGVDLPKLSGSSVMAMNMPGGRAAYRFTSAKLMGSIDVVNAKTAEAGTFEPYSVSLNFIDHQWTCGMSSVNKDQDLKLTIEKTSTGYRGTYAGDVTCTPIKGGERKKAKAKGWFVN